MNTSKVTCTMKTKKYNMSFTSGALLHRESSLVLKSYMRLQDWNEVEKEVLDKNILQSRTQSTSKRIYREIASRLSKLTKNDILTFHSATNRDQGYILWLSICRKYKFIAEFAREVVREKFLSLQDAVSSEDYAAFFNAKAEWAPELDELRQSTQQKLRQILFRMLREANLLSNDNRIIPVMCSQHMEVFFKESNNFLFFSVQAANGWGR